MAERLVEFWASADEYWDAVEGGRARPTMLTEQSTMTTLHITVGDQEQHRDDILEFVDAADGDALDESDERAVLNFRTYGDLVSLTPVRLDLLQAGRYIWANGRRQER